MHDDRIVSCENIVPRFHTLSILPPPHPWTGSLEENLPQLVLKTFIIVFIQYNEGLENKLTRAPPLGLAKSIYYLILWNSYAAVTLPFPVGDRLSQVLFLRFFIYLASNIFQTQSLFKLGFILLITLHKAVSCQSPEIVIPSLL